MRHLVSLLLLASCTTLRAADAPPDLIVHNARVITVDARFRIASAVAVRAGRIVVVGDDRNVLALKGPKTHLIDAKSRTVLPGLFDSHMHPIGAVTTEFADPPPVLHSLKEVFAFIRRQVVRFTARDSDLDKPACQSHDA